MLIRLVWPQYDEHGVGPVDAFWVECTEEEARAVLGPEANLPEPGPFPGEPTDSFCLLVARDRRFVRPMRWLYPHSGLWNAYNPFRELPTPGRIASLGELEYLPLPGDLPEPEPGPAPPETYAARLKAHLAHYKRERLGVNADGVAVRWKRSYPHILPEPLRRLAILETIRAEFWQYGEERELGRPEARIRLHRDFHHLNSSQALAFNLFFPFFRGGDEAAKVLLAALRLPTHAIAAWCFEHVADHNEGTAFDFFLRSADGPRVYFEVKLSESAFGACKANEARRRKLEEIYRPRLVGKVDRELLTEGGFFANYQLLRNLSYVDPEREDRLVLLIPRANEALRRETDSVLERVLSPARAYVQRVWLEDLFDALGAAQPSDPLLEAHVHLLREKYLP